MKMNKITLAIVLSLVIATSSQANTRCLEFRELAFSAMKNRQKGHNINIFINALNNTKSDKPTRDLAILILRTAYTIPRFSNDFDRAVATRAFADGIYRSCVK